MSTLDNFLSSVVNQFIVRPTGSPNIVGVGGFIFDILDAEEVSLDAEVTDHFVEANYAVQDHIATRPLMFTLRGYVAELADLQTNNILSNLFNTLVLGPVSAYAPQFTTQAVQAYTQLAAITAQTETVISQAQSIFNIFQQKSTTANYQQQAFSFFQNIWMNRQLCTVETPFNTFENMAIVSLRAIQKGETKIISDFAVTFKQIRTTSTIMDVSTPLAVGRALDMIAPPVASGTITGAAISADPKTLMANYFPGA